MLSIYPIYEIKHLKTPSKIRILLTSTGFDNKKFERLFIDNIGKPIKEVRVLFVPTAANDKESKEVVPFCRKELIDAGVLSKNIVTYNLDRPMEIRELMSFDAIYFCGGSETHLMKAIHKANFANVLIKAVKNGLFYIGVSAGSMIATGSVKNNLGFIPNPLEPHCEKDVTPDGKIPKGKIPINISDNQAVWITNDDAIIIQ